MSNLLPNRAARRELAKKLGLLEKKAKAPYDKRMEMIRRSIDTGNAIHRRNVEETLRSQEAAASQKEVDKIQSIVDFGISPEDAVEEVKK